MLTKTIRYIAVCAGFCALFPYDALAVSGRQIAIANAFRYAYDNPQQETGTGPLASSIYYGGPPVGSVRPSGPVPPGYLPANNPISGAFRPVQTYTPMTGMTLTPAGASPGGPPIYGAASADPVRDLVSALARQGAGGPSYLANGMTSLAPATPGAYRSAMISGEQAFREGKYEQALGSFRSAQAMSKDSAESLLSLAQTYFALGGKTYGEAAQCLAKTIKLFPELPLVRVCPKDFFGDANAYAKAYGDLAKFVQENPKDAAARFLLGYCQFRDRLLDQALDSLKAALASSPSPELQTGISDLLDGISRASQIALADAPALGKPVDYSWAGIRLAMPQSFEPSPLASVNQVVTGAVPDSNAGPGYPVTLYAYAISQTGTTLETFMDFMTDAMRRSPGVQNMTVDCEAEVPFKTDRALVRIIAYTNASTNNDSLMAWVAFFRQGLDPKGPHVGYILGIAMSRQQEARLLPALAAVARSATLIDPLSPPADTLDMQGAVFDDTQLGFSISLPVGWAGQPTDKGYEMGQLDFARGGAVSPRVQVITQAIPANYTAKSFGEEAVQRRTPKGMVRKILSQAPLQLAGQEGYQFVVSQTPEDASSGPGAILVGRLACAAAPDGKKILYALVVQRMDAQPKDVETLMDKIAASFTISPPQAAPPAGK